jgi:hypothetical protein
MTTTLMPPESAAPAETPSRTLSITVNLLPPEVVEARHVGTVRRIVLSALVVVVALLTGWYGVASYQTAAARGSLSSAESDVRRLERQQRDFADLVGIQKESQTIRNELSTLLASDLQWSAVLAAVQGAAPAGVQITNVAGALTSAGNGTGGGSTGPQLPNTTGRRLIGSLTLTGTASNKAAVAEYVNKLAAVPALGNPFIASSMPQDKVERFTVRLDITDSALGGRYPSKIDKQAGGK